MVDTALLVAVIGIAGTLTASILTVLSEPWRQRRERVQEGTLKQESIRKALYSELAQIAVKLQTAMLLIHDTEQEQEEAEELQEKLQNYQEKRDEAKQIIGDVPEGSTIPYFLKLGVDVFQNAVEETDRLVSMLDQTVRTIKGNRSNVIATFKLLFDLKGGIYKLVKSDPELAVLFYQLSEAYVVDSFYSIVNNYVELAALSEDLDKQWESVVSSFNKMREVFLEGERSERLDIATLKSCCTLSSDVKHLDDLLTGHHNDSEELAH